jgi:adsorption protein B
MPNELILFIYFIMWYLLVIFSCLFFLSGLDDLFIDIYYWIRYAYRLWKYRHSPPLTYQRLNDKPEQWVAVLVPCWHEAGVISTMLRHNCNSIDYKNYYIFVGVYPNDPSTVADVQSVADEIYHVKCVIGETPGPTNKAANLNGVYRYVKSFEQTLGVTFDIFIFHDSEDIIHPLSFKLYNYLCPQNHMIQIPIFPLSVPYSNFTHWVYADEFSEIHTKDIIVREAIRGHVPSAGVGTAFSRHALKVLEDPVAKTPFSTDSLTEDYRTSLSLRLKNLKQIFVTQRITHMQWRKAGLFRKGYVQKPIREYIATRALFPTEYTKAVRQKARWIIGIVFQESRNIKWPKQWSVRFTLSHDRKAFLTHFINGVGYFVFLFWILYSLITRSSPSYPSLQEQFNLHPWVWEMILFVTLIMLERMLQRAIGIWRVYRELIPALLSIPRVFYGNIINLHAVLRAFNVYYSTPKAQTTTGGTKLPVWDKTDHHFPGSHILTPYKIKLGELLLKKKLISEKHLIEAVTEQRRTGERLGSILCRLGRVTEHDILEVLAEQFHLDIIKKSQLSITDKSLLAALPDSLSRWLIKNQIQVVEVIPDIKLIKIAINDPTNEPLIAKVISAIEPYKAEFLLVDPDA